MGFRIRLLLALFVALPLSASAAPDYPGASSYIQGIHYTPRSGRKITYVVIHTIEGSAAGAISWFKNPKSRVSAHYIVSKAGVVTQMIREKDRAWHAGSSSYNERSIGIENGGYAGKNLWTEVQYRELAKLTRYLCDKYTIPIDRKHIIAHKEVPGSTHWDPGPHFKWDYFLHLVRTGKPPKSDPEPDPEPEPKPDPAPGDVGCRYVTASRLNVRTGSWGSILGQTHRGRVHASNRVSGSWRRLYWRGQTAWFWGAYTRADSAHAVKVTASALNVRTSPKVGNNWVGKVYRGQVYREIMRSGSWVLIQFDHRREWVHGSYVTRVK